MTKKELEKRISQLEMLVEQKDRFIGDLLNELDNKRQQVIPYFNPVFNPVFGDRDDCIDGNGHDYPTVWHSILPPYCKKCGKQAKSYDVTYSDKTGNPPSFDQFGGNMMYNKTTTTDFILNSDNKTGLNPISVTN